MLPFTNEALWVANKEVSPDGTADKGNDKEVDVGLAAKNIDSTEDLSELLLCWVFRVLRAQFQQPEVAGQGDQAGKACR